ncbi:Filamentous hemagglutinin (plasmid) [Variovorax sp. SRS16]|uniref:two-partner secretion domain-containing protein n=1 Tax=Variovorax sp. SRS16 TaxID=282217 RepID=UPI001317B52E|nr:filamentous hemagglutinin N-terminal domain-containing protein [Variovorax sp. SRS16]VTU46443.1 Filamentous hemagglutinin [Variovorax sp. SRS16]
MVVQETATCMGKAKGITSAAVGIALALIIGSASAHAQIVGASNVPGTLRPTVLVAPNGVAVANIQTPNSQRVSTNIYSQFDVPSSGVVLNNSRKTVQTQLGGYIQGNPWLATGPARIILNEINSGNPTQIRGYIEVGGSKAEVIVANPAGIAVDGGGFINASKATLTTGAPQLSATGTLDSYAVRSGTVTVNGAGLDLSHTDYAAILARAVQINGAIHATDLQVVTGANQISADATQISPTTSTGVAPTFAFDVAAIGGMFANHIFLVGMEAGLGMRNAGAIQATATGAPSGLMSAGQFVVNSAGLLQNSGTIQAASDASLTASSVVNTGSVLSGGSLKVASTGDLSNIGGTLEGQRVDLSSTAGNIVNSNGTIRQSSYAALTLAAPSLMNTQGGTIGAEPVPATSGDSGSGSSGAGANGTAGGGSSGNAGTGSGSGTSSGTSTEPSTTPASAPIAPGTVSAAGAIQNDGGHIYASGPISLQTPNASNVGGTLSVDSMAVSGPAFSNAGGHLNVNNAFSANVGSFDNSAGTVHAGSIGVTTTGDFNNTAGILTSDGDANISAGGTANNAQGTISAAGALSAKVSGGLSNASGTLLANQAVTIKSQSLENTLGSIQSAAAGTSLTVIHALINTGSIGAATDLSVQAGSLVNGSSGSLRAANDTSMSVAGAAFNDGGITSGRHTTIAADSLAGAGTLGAGIHADGSLGTAGDLSVTTTNALAATGTNLAAGNANLQGASVDLTNSKTSASNIAITATQGNVTTSSANVVTPGTLAIAANTQSAQTLINDAGVLNVNVLDLRASNIASTNGGQIVQTGTQASTIAASGTIVNTDSLIASNGQDLTLQAGSITNTNGRIEHAGAGALGITGGSLSGANGQITTNGALAANFSGVFDQDGGTTTAKQINLNAGSLSNRGGQIVQTGAGATNINVAGAMDNSVGGTIASNGATTIAAGTLNNQGSTVRAAGTSDLSVTTSGLLDNSAAGTIAAGGNATVNAGGLKSETGGLTAVGNLAATIMGAATNVDGTLASNGSTTISAASLDSTNGHVVAVTGNLGVTTSDATTNTGGSLEAAGTTTLNNGGLINDHGTVSGNAVSIDAHGGTLNNAQGTIAATTTVGINSGALINDAGLIQSGAAMTVNTHGQALDNSNAAGYASTGPAEGQGGIASADTLILNSGALNNSAGFIGSKNALAATTGAVSNIHDGVIVGQAGVTINTQGAAFNNTGGQIQAVGDLSVNAGNVINNAGLLRANGNTSVVATSIDNSSTSGTNQGIEGQNVTITTGNLNNTAGAIRSDRATGNTTITASGIVDNSSGLISAGDTLAIVDPNAANPAAKTLAITNAAGTLTANKSLKLDAARFSADGTFTSGQNLSVALTQDVINNADIEADGNLMYTTTGNLTNNGKLIAGGTLTAGGNVVENTAAAEMSGTDTQISATTLSNRGLIDNQGQTRIDAGTVNNIGTGRVYGDAVAIGAGTLNNSAENVSGTITAATIAGRSSVDIGAGTINNSDDALIFSAGDMYIGGALNANGYATGQGSTLNNHSAMIQSLGDMSISMAAVNNVDMHLTVTQGTTSKTDDYLATTADNKIWSITDTTGNPITGQVWHTNPNGTQTLVGIGYGDWHVTTTTTGDIATNQDPAQIIAGGNLSINGHLSNKDSKVIAGGTLTAPSPDNETTQGTAVKTYFGYTWAFDGSGNGAYIPLVKPADPPATISLGTFVYEGNTNATGGFNAGAAPDANGARGSAAGTGAVSAKNGPATIMVVANVGTVINASGSSAGSANAADGASGTSASQTVSTVVRTSTPNAALPRASLFSLEPGSTSHYLIETDPRFADYRTWLSSDYLMNNLGLDPDNTEKRLGDGFYEQLLIDQQVMQLTGYRYVSGYSDDESEYTALMSAGATFAKQYGLTVGVALTVAQMAQLTSDIVWLVSQTVTLPDGTTQQVLVPQVYVRVQPGDIDGSGALLSADKTVINAAPGTGDVTNTGTIAGRTLVSITADNVNNLGGRISGGSVAVTAVNDINDIGGTIDAKNSMTLQAGHDINVQTTTSSTSSAMGAKTVVDRVAGLYVTNPGGTLVASAGNDVNLAAAIVKNQSGDSASGLTSITAKHNIHLDTVQTGERQLMASSPGNYIGYSNSQEVGSTLSTNGTTALSANNDINARWATVSSGDGFLSVHADHDTNISDGESSQMTVQGRQSSKKNILSSSTTSSTIYSSSTTSVGSSFSGGLTALTANHNINIEGSQISGTEGVLVQAGNNLNVWEGRNTTDTSISSATSSRTLGLGSALVGLPSVGPSSKSNSTELEIRTDTAAPSSIQSNQGGVLLQAGGTVFLEGAQVSAAKDISIIGTEVGMKAAVNSTSIEGTSNSSSKGFTSVGQAIYADPSTGFNAKKTTDTTIDDSSLTRTTLSGANVSITATDTLAMAGTTVNTPGKLSLNADNLVLGTQTTERDTQETSQGRDLAYQKIKDKGQSDQTTNYNQFNVGTLAVTANHIDASLGAKDSLAALAQQPGMSWAQQLNSDPALQGKVNWSAVEEAHKNWNSEQQGLTPEGAAIVTLVVAYFTAGAASELGAAAGTSAGTTVAGGTVATLGEGGFIAAGGATASSIVGGAVTAGLSALAGEAAVALINNQGNIAATLHDLGSSANVKSLATAIITGGALENLGLSPIGLPGGGDQAFFTQLQQNVAAAAAKAATNTAINGGSFEKNLAQALETGLIDTVAAQTAFAIGDSRVGANPALTGFTTEIAHAIAGCAIGAGRTAVANSSGGSSCGAGAIGAVVGNLAASFALANEAQNTTAIVAFSQMFAGLAGAMIGGNASDINITAQAGANAAANNELLHLGNSVEALTRSGYTLVPISLPGYGDAYVDPRMATALEDWMGLAADQGVTITFNSSFRVSGQPVSGAVYTPAGDSSLHNAGLAVDVRYGKLEDISGGLTADQQRAILRDTAAQAGLSWGGNFSKPDDVHFYIDPYGVAGIGRIGLIQTQQSAFNFLIGK